MITSKNKGNLVKFLYLLLVLEYPMVKLQQWMEYSKKLEKLLEDFMKDNESNSQNKNDKKVRLARYALKLLDVVRSENARLAQTSYFFSILQEELREEVWNKFTEDFIKNPKLDDSPNPTPIWELEPTEFHMYIAEQVVNCKPPAIAASLNYDGLTARAIQKKP